MVKKQPFQYKPRSKDDIERRKQQAGSMFDNPTKSEFKNWAPKEGDHRFRVMPPTWEGAEHYGLDVWLHSNVGPDNQTYICLQKMRGEACPVCEELKRAQREGDSKYADELKPYQRVLLWVIDRDNEKDGPLLYMCPKKIDIDITNLSVDKHTGEVLCIDDPDQGYDVAFTREGTGMKTKYVGVEVARRPSAISVDEDQASEWLDYVVANPLPSTLYFYDYEHVKNAFSGAPKKKDGVKEETEDAPPVPRSRTTPSTTKAPQPAADDDDLDDAPPTPKSQPRSRPQPDPDDEEAAPPAPKPRPQQKAPKEEPADDEETAPPAPSSAASLRDRLRQKLNGGSK